MSLRDDGHSGALWRDSRAWKPQTEDVYGML